MEIPAKNKCRIKRRKLGILTLIISTLCPIAALALMPPSPAPTAPTRLRSMAFSPDKTINLSGTILAPNQVAVDSLSGTVRVLSSRMCLIRSGLPGIIDAPMACSS
jgi:hypothetical protein